MINNMKTILSAVKQYVESGIKKSVPDWNEADSDSINYIKNKTHYDSRETIIETENISLTFDGNLEGKESIQMDEYVYYIKLSDTPLTKEQIVGGVLKGKNADGTENIMELSEAVLEEVLYGNEYMIDIGEGFFVSVFQENSDEHPFSVGVWGVYVVDNVYISSFTNTVITETETGELKKIHEKYLPEFSKVGKSGTGKHSEIFNDYAENVASGQYSHAEGQITTASGGYSHAEGGHTTASGSNSHAEGGHTTASGSNSHAEGWNTTASSTASHAEGRSTTASGNSSHAEGNGTTASGSNSHAEGDGTQALGNKSHAEGSGSTISLSLTGSANSKSYKVNSNNTYIKIGRVLKYKDTYAIITNYNVSTLTITTDKTLSSTALSKTSVNLVLGIAYGEGSHVEGQNTVASSPVSHAEGNSTTASGDYSHAEGDSTIASGDYSHAEGNGADATGKNSHAEGYNTTASGTYSHAEGQASKVSGIAAHAEGFNTTASGSHSHAEGSEAEALGNYSHAEGYRTTASGENSHAEGYSKKVILTLTGDANSTSYKVSSGNADIKIGRILNYISTYARIVDYDSSTLTIITDTTLSSSRLNNATVYLVLGIASGISSHAEGNNTTASGSCSHAEGDETIAYGHYSHAEGYRTEASGSYSHAEGNQTEASGHFSHAEGQWSTASGEFSHAEGNNTTASGSYSHAEGYRTKASGDYQHVQGKYNIEDPENNYVHIVGNGTSDSSRSNAHTLDWDGNAWFKGDVYVYGSDPDTGFRLAKEVNVDSAIKGLEHKINEPIYNYFDHGIILENERFTGTQAESSTTYHKFIIGDTYKVVWDGVEYDNLVAENWEDEFDGIGGVFGSDYTTYPFGLCTGYNNYITIYASTDESHTFSLYHYVNGEIIEEETLKIEHMPDMTALTLLSPNGTRFNITVGDDGVLSATEITEGGN